MRAELKNLREKKGLSQKEAAEKIGISQSMLAMLESGKRSGSDSTKIRVAEFYKKSVSSLFFKSIITK